MHDQIGMCMCDSGEHVEKQADALFDAEAAAVTIFVDVVALDMLEYKVGLSSRRAPASSNSAMWGCTSRPKMLPSRLNRSSPPRPDWLRLTNLTAARRSKSSIAALRQPHRPHAALSNRRQEPVRSDAPPREFRLRRQVDWTGVQESFLIQGAVPLKEPLYAIGEFRVLFSERRHPGGALIVIESQSVIQIGTYRLPFAGRSVWTLRPPASRQVGTDSVVQVNAGLLPVPLNGAFRDASHARDLHERKSAKKFQIHNFCQSGFYLGEFI